MKIVLSGTTGYIGSAILQHCLSHPDITSLIILSRRPITSPTTNREISVENIVLDDFTKYPTTALQALSTADAAIWCIGTYHGDENVDAVFPEMYRRAQVEALAKNSSSSKQTFRYVHLGGAFTESNPDASLWYLDKARKVRGKAEVEAAQFEESVNGERDVGRWETHVVKPAAILPLSVTKSSGLRYVLGCLITGLVGRNLSVCLDEVAAFMVDVALNGGSSKVKVKDGHVGDMQSFVWLNQDVVEHGRAILMEK